MKKLLHAVVVVLLIAYPFLVGWGLAQGHFFWVSMILIGLGVIRLLSKKQQLLWPLTLFAILCGSLSLFLNSGIWLKLYPVMMSIGGLVIFASTLFRPPSMIERFARLIEPDLPETGVRWTRKVTKVWCYFFALNGLISLTTVYLTSTQVWVWYNGFLSYVLMGLLLLGEYILRKRQMRIDQQSKT
ncbi:septation protein IspZ [Acinetobacter rudis]|uniref:Clp protease n=1 Tax=Acinetobacter rudis CIP 110305 TaxID=421052 RepID=S3MQ18_9GAMM|nr:septation protein IspZ [Acinetobacter rudis]EPF70020.1 hypothetical protein F945_03584 [Acinetobacter rudis CIP 110305]